MRAVLTALISAIEGAATALVGFVVVAVPLLLVWWLDFDLSAEPNQMVSVAAGGWLLGHLVPLTLVVSPETALSFGLEPAALSFTISLAPLGITLITVLLAARVGWQLAERGGVGASGLFGGAVGFGLAAWVAASLAAPFRGWPLWAAILVPALCYGVSAALSYVLHSALRGNRWWLHSVRFLQRGILRLDPLRSAGFDDVRPGTTGLGAAGHGAAELRAAALPARAVEVLRLAAGSVAGLIGLSALAVAVAVVLGYIDIVTLSQTLQLDALGLVVLFLLNLALLPVACIWGIAWLTGAGFSIGVGSSVTPFETLLGPLPAFPLLGAVPQGWGWAGGLAPALVVLAAVAIGALAGGRTELRHGSLTTSIVVPLLAAVLAGLAVAGLAALAAGAIGPERLSITGPKPWTVGMLAALEIGIGLVPGVLARRLDLDRWRRAVPIWVESPDRAERMTDSETVQVNNEFAGQYTGGASNELADQETQPLGDLRVKLFGTEGNANSEPEDSVADDASTDDDERADDDHSADGVGSSDDDELLRAFSWGDTELTSEGDDADRAAPTKRGWRFPWRER